MTKEKINLKLKTENVLEFSLAIKGSISESTQANSAIRFTITDTSSGISVSFPARKEKGMVTAIIPPMSQMFREDVVYEGKLEVIFGNNYFNPINLNLQFEAALEIEGTLVKRERPIVEEKKTQHEDEFINSVIKQASPKQSAKGVEQKIFQKAMFSTGKPSPTPTIGEETFVTKKRPQKAVVLEDKEPVEHDDPLEAYKNRLKSMIAGAIKEV
jgi:hypothetical protein